MNPASALHPSFAAPTTAERCVCGHLRSWHINGDPPRGVCTVTSCNCRSYADAAPRSPAAPAVQEGKPPIPRPDWAPADATHALVDKGGAVVEVYRRYGRRGYSYWYEGAEEWDYGYGSWDERLVDAQPLAAVVPQEPPPAQPLRIEYDRDDTTVTVNGQRYAFADFGALVPRELREDLPFASVAGEQTWLQSQGVMRKLPLGERLAKGLENVGAALRSPPALNEKARALGVKTWHKWRDLRNRQRIGEDRHGRTWITTLDEPNLPPAECGWSLGSRLHDLVPDPSLSPVEAAPGEVEVEQIRHAWNAIADTAPVEAVAAGEDGDAPEAPSRYNNDEAVAWQNGWHRARASLERELGEVKRENEKRRLELFEAVLALGELAEVAGGGVDYFERVAMPPAPGEANTGEASNG